MYAETTNIIGNKVWTGSEKEEISLGSLENSNERQDVIPPIEEEICSSNSRFFPPPQELPGIFYDRGIGDDVFSGLGSPVYHQCFDLRFDTPPQDGADHDRLPVHPEGGGADPEYALRFDPGFGKFLHQR